MDLNEKTAKSMQAVFALIVLFLQCKSASATLKSKAVRPRINRFKNDI
jgi:hypothetical protein